MTINIDPVIGSIGPFVFHWYGIIMAAAVLAGVWIFSGQLRRRGIPSNHALGIAVIAVPCGIIGARLFSVFDNLGYYWHNPGKIFGLGLVGLAIYGVLAGGIFGLVVYCRWKKLPLLRVVDSTALAFPVGQIIGRFANIINGDTWGPPTDLPWAFTYTNPHAFLPADLLGVPTHPTPVYEQLWLIVVVAALLVLIPRLNRSKADGMAFFAYLGLYSLGRFFISYYRVNNIIFLGMREAQLFAVAGIIVAPLAMYLLWRRRPKPAASNRGPKTAGSGRSKPPGSGQGHKTTRRRRR